MAHPPMMRPVPVVWLSLADGIKARGYWDQGLLEEMFEGFLWLPPGMPEVEHVVLDEHRPWSWPPPQLVDAELSSGTGKIVRQYLRGAVVVVPAQHHAHDDAVNWLCQALDSLPWSLVILTGDEAHEFPVERIEGGANRRVWVMTPENSWVGDRRIGMGFPPHTQPPLIELSAEAAGRRCDWAFAGQITHARRREFVQAARSLEGGRLFETDHFAAGMDPDAYMRFMAGAKVAPCPSGATTVDTMRLYEALEAGCIPVVDNLNPHRVEAGYWDWVLPGHAFPHVTHWDQFAALLPLLLEGWPANANRVFAHWQAHKRAMATWFRDDVRGLQARTADAPDRELTIAELVTVVITTSPTIHNPELDHLEAVIDSVRHHLPDSEIILVADGVRPEQETLRDDYEEYLRRVLWKANTSHWWRNVLPVLLHSWGHQALATRRALEEVTTPLILFVEHDTPLTADPIDWDAATRVVYGGELDLLRFYHEAQIHPDHEHLMLDAPRVTGLPYVRTVQWSQRPHLASLRFYKRILDEYFGQDSRTMIEDVMHSVVQVHYNEWGEEGWNNFRLGLYHPDGIEKRSDHLDTRSGAPKYDMRFGYNGEAAPVGAPQPTAPPHDGL